VDTRKTIYQGKNQLSDLLSQAKVVVAVFDPHQILTTVEYRSDSEIQKMILDASAQNNLVELEN